MKTLGIIFIAILFFLAACGSNNADNESADQTAPPTHQKQASADDKGIGLITHVELNNPLNSEMVKRGMALYELKCAACHKLSDQRVVGPGWAGITERRTPEWIMNMTTNVEAMLTDDPTARELLRECLVRMPNQTLSEADARDILEFMLDNDAKE